MKAFVVGALMFWGIAGSMQLKADEAIEIAVRPRVTKVGGSAQLKVLVARNAVNRVLQWEVDGPNYYRRSELPLDGAAAPRSYLFVVRDLPAGEFEIRATVVRQDESTAVDRSDIKVIGPS
jgi:hypothetical protein